MKHLLLAIAVAAALTGCAGAQATTATSGADGVYMPSASPGPVTFTPTPGVTITHDHTLPSAQHEAQEKAAAKEIAQAAAEVPWWYGGTKSKKPGETNYGPSGGPTIGLTTIGDGCDRNYASVHGGEVCVPVVPRRAPDIQKKAGEATTCAGLRNSGYLAHGLVVVGEDDQHLDADADTVACESGE